MENFEPLQENPGMGPRVMYRAKALMRRRPLALALVAAAVGLVALMALVPWSPAQQLGTSPATEAMAEPQTPDILKKSKFTQLETIPDSNVQFPINSAHPDAGVTASMISKSHYPGYPLCEDKVAWMMANWNATTEVEKTYRAQGVDGTIQSILRYLNENGLFCPTYEDASRVLFRGVCLGGWLVLEPWITPSLFEQFAPALNVEDHWRFCEALGKVECKRQLEAHWDTFVTEAEVKELAAAGINMIRIPVGYWVMGDIRPDEPWVNGELFYLQRAMAWFKNSNISVMLDLHCAPGSQNGFDNSGKKGSIHWADPSHDAAGNVFYPNIDRSITVLSALVSMFSVPPFHGVIKYIELVNEAFISIDIDVVKDFYTRGYEAVRAIDPDVGIIIGDSFRFGAWKQFMYPPNYRHVYIDTHIYQVFDAYRLSMTVDQHIDLTCKANLPEVAIAPLSTIVGEWSGALTDCAKWLNGYLTGSRYDGTFPGSGFIGSCEGQNNHTSALFTPEYKADLRRYIEYQMDAYESGSAMGWTFWNFKTESAPQWDYLLGLREGWIPNLRLEPRNFSCSTRE